MSCIDLTSVSNNLANSCEWNVKDNASIGSDHFPIIYSFNVEIDYQDKPSHETWWFEKADWQKELHKKLAYSIFIESNIEECASEISHEILNAELNGIPFK